MKRQWKSLCSLGAFAIILAVGVSLNAQQSTAPSSSTDPAAAPAAQPMQPNDPTAQAPATTPQTQTTPAPETPAQTAPDATAGSSAETQSFSGTIVKVGDKYVLQDADSGKTYDIDHQDDVKKFEGKRVKVQGKLDDTGTKILVK